MFRILIVEDDENLRLALADNLEAEGYAVTCAATGAEADAAIDGGSFDLIVLDIMLPDTDGYRICRDLRAQGHDAMVLMLTARTLEDDLVTGFDAGADDYLAKPYRLKELLARVQALLRRRGARVQGARTIGPYTVDTEGRRVSNRKGEDVPLTRTELDLFLLLLDNDGRALPRDEILDRVWGEGVVVDGRTVDNFVSHLKKKLGQGEGAGFVIHTVRGVGYRMELLTPHR